MRVEPLLAWAALFGLGVIAGRCSDPGDLGATLPGSPPLSSSTPPPATDCVVQSSGLAKPRSPVIDPELDPQLVGVASPWPEDLAQAWSEDALREVLGPVVTLHCDEWPCLLEIRFDDEDPTTAIRSMPAVVALLAEAGLDAASVGRQVPVVDAETETFALLMPLRPADREPSPQEELREEVRLFWLTEWLSR